MVLVCPQLFMGQNRERAGKGLEMAKRRLKGVCAGVWVMSVWCVLRMRVL